MERYDPYAHAEQLGIRVEHQSLRTINGLWVPDHNMIILRSGMRALHTRSTLAHEIGHADLGHRDDRPKHEVMADRYAANHLINKGELIDLMQWTRDLNKVAQELEVSGRILRVYLNVNRLAG